MVVFLANRANIQLRQLHRRIANRFVTDDRFSDVRLRIADAREPGPYRVEASTNPRVFLDDQTYPVDTARIEVGFVLGEDGNDQYWFNWIEPTRHFLLGWHQDHDHAALGAVHLQATQHDTAVDHVPATFIDDHPLAVLETRLSQLPGTLERVRWEDDTVVELQS